MKSGRPRLGPDQSKTLKRVQVPVSAAVFRWLQREAKKREWSVAQFAASLVRAAREEAGE
ncbi:MAG TPA: hypothetical protein VFI02_08745 [Armatimonadota bacterium]|nr:hypothetical protein [Armatimonadota bacterium]